MIKQRNAQAENRIHQRRGIFIFSPASLLVSRNSMGYVCPNPGTRTCTPGELDDRRLVLL